MDGQRAALRSELSTSLKTSSCLIPKSFDAFFSARYRSRSFLSVSTLTASMRNIFLRRDLLINPFNFPLDMRLSTRDTSNFRIALAFVLEIYLSQPLRLNH